MSLLQKCDIKGKVTFLLVILLICFSITGGTYQFMRFEYDASESHAVTDSLNDRAYAMRYCHHDSAMIYAQQAEASADKYEDGRIEAKNHRLFQACLDIDCVKGNNLYDEIQKGTQNQIELLISEISMMMMCQRTAQNLLYTEYQKRAGQRISRIEEEENLEGRYAERYFYALNEYKFIEALNALQLSKIAEAETEIDEVYYNEALRDDKSLWTDYHYIKGLISLNKSATDNNEVVKAFDYLFQAYAIADRYQLIYLKSLICQVFSEMLSNSRIDQLLDTERKNEAHYLFNQFVAHDVIEQGTDNHLHVARSMAQESIENAATFGNVILAANGLLALGDTYFYDGQTEEALNYYERALQQLNLHHQTYYPEHSDEELKVFEDKDGPSIDMKWVEDADVQTIPATLLHIREALSRAYSAIDDKQISDYNRNVYLDILNHTRADKSIESHLYELNQSYRAVNIIFWVIIIALIMVITLLAFLVKSWKKRKVAQIETIKKLSQWYISTSDNGENKDVEQLLESIERRQDKNQIQQEILSPFVNWMQKNRTDSSENANERLSLYEDYLQSEQQIDRNKRTNIVKRAKVSLVHAVMPFIDRILYAAHRMQQQDMVDNEQLTYIKELTDKIEEYNIVLTDWIQMNKGEIGLTIETFALQELFNKLSKSAYSFERKGLTLNIKPTNTIIKADKALTFFMLNTLAENSRKFTPDGGKITIEALEQDNYVEIAVSDTGIGLSEKDRQIILSSKTFDAQKIGTASQDVQKAKGHGFGLLNCKGIIEKYKKTSPIFDVCHFDIQSTQGVGSRFSFRLPKGILKSIVILLISMCGTNLPTTLYAGTNDNMREESRILCNNNDLASYQCVANLADSVYFSNINGDYESAIVFAGKALQTLNQMVVSSQADSNSIDSLTLANNGHSQEMEWWRLGIETDYQLIMNLRNEIAVSALALHEWDLYEFNNQMFTSLYNAYTKDDSLLDTFVLLQEKKHNHTIGIILCVFLTFLAILTIYILYLRKFIAFRFNTMKMIEINRALLNSTDEDETLENLLKLLSDGLMEIHELTGVKLLLHNNSLMQNRIIEHIIKEGTFIDDNLLYETFNTKKTLFDSATNTKVMPLVLHESGEVNCIGALGLCYGNYQIENDDNIYDQFVVNCFTLIIKNSILRHETEIKELKTAENEKQRALFEENRLHVQNLILDNCLSVIKHESLYYPGRIKQIVNNIIEDGRNEPLNKKFSDLVEIVDYYKDIYTLLCKQADKQIDTGLFKSVPIKSSEIAQHWIDYGNRIIRKNNSSTKIKADIHEEILTYADKSLLFLLLEVLTKEWLLMEQDGKRINELTLHSVKYENEFVKYALNTPIKIYKEDEIPLLFQPQLGHNTYLLCKEIIREHDKLNNFCGCRINIEMNQETGTTIWFTFPIKR